MATPLSKDNLETLDISDLDLSQLIDHAVSALKVDLAEETKKHLEHPDTESSINDYTFREQWVLRWLLRRFTSEKSLHSNSHDIKAPLTKSWMLLLHLLYAIPRAVSAEVLAERKFLQCLDHRIRLPTRTSLASPPAANGRASGNGFVDTAAERPIKRRRLSPEQEPPSSPKEHPFSDYVDIVFRVCCRFASIVASRSVLRKQNEHSAGLAWTSDVQENATAFAASLRVALAYLRSPSSGRSESIGFSQLEKLLGLWDCRPVAVFDIAKANEVAAFNTSCLSPCLELLNVCRELSNKHEQAKVCAQRLEKLLALHTLLPLRTNFNDGQSQQWKKSRICLSWHDIMPVYKDMAGILAPQEQSSDERTIDMFDVDWKAWSPHLYSIAIRLIPKSDFRRKQWEQPWLEALFASLCYLACPALPRLDFSPPDTVSLLEPAHSADTEHGLDAINALVRVAIEQHATVSLQVLSYVSSAVLSSEFDGDQWEALSKMVSLDVNILIPGLGVPTTDYGINKLRENLHGHSFGERDYHTLRDGIVLPLVLGFARTRALKVFVKMWRTEMMMAMKLRTPAGGSIHAMMVWEDEDVFDRVGEMVGQYGTPALTQEVFTRTLQSLEELDSSPAPIESVADAAICTAFLEAREISAADPSKLQHIQDAAVTILTQKRYHHTHSWRLWNLIHGIQETKTLPHLATDILAVTDEGHESLSLQAVEMSASALCPRTSQWRERSERFSILVQQTSTGNKPFSVALETEIIALQGSISTLRHDEAVWNGRMADLNSPDKVISACLGTLLSRPEVLQMYPDLALTLLQKLEGESSHESQVTPCVSDVFHNLIASVQANGTKPVSEKLNKTMLDAAADPTADNPRLDLIDSLHIESMSKSQLRTVASSMFDRLSASSHRMSLERLAEHLALMDRVGARSSVSFCQGDAWSTWVGLLSALEKRDFEDDLSHISTVSRCIMSMLRKVVTLLVDDGVKGGSDVLSPILKWCRGITKSSSPLKHGISRFLGLRTCMNILRDACDKLDESVSKSFRKLGREYVQRVSDAVITILDGTSKLSETDYWELTGLLQALSEVETISPAPEDLISFVQSSELACHGSFASHSDDPGGFPEHFIASAALFRQYLNHWTPKRKNSPLRKVGMETSLAYPNAWNEMSDQQQLLLVATRANNLVRTLDVEGQADLLELMAQNNHEATAGPMVPCMVAAIVLQADASQFPESPRLIQHLGDVASLARCTRLTDQTRLLLALDNARFALDTHPKIINQATIDSLLSNMSLLLGSSSSLKLRNGDADTSFERIMAITGSLLSRFRRRLSDRHHLLLPLLQQLLRCFFYAGLSSQHSLRHPAQGSNPAAFLKALPPWLRSSTHPLPATSAENYTRIISSICNPTVSAAKSSSSRKRSGAANELNDETKRVKTLAGEHMQYLVMEYCRCMLDGVIAPQVKEKLMPGMYTVLESMSRDLMRGMNAAMDPSSKAIFKGLYDDWVRYGKWDRS